MHIPDIRPHHTRQELTICEATCGNIFKFQSGFIADRKLSSTQ